MYAFSIVFWLCFDNMIDNQINMETPIFKDFDQIALILIFDYSTMGGFIKLPTRVWPSSTGVK